MYPYKLPKPLFNFFSNECACEWLKVLINMRWFITNLLHEVYRGVMLAIEFLCFVNVWPVGDNDHAE